MTTEDEPKAKVFISYSRRDMAFVDGLEGALKERGFEPLIDRSRDLCLRGLVEAHPGADRAGRTVVFVLQPRLRRLRGLREGSRFAARSTSVCADRLPGVDDKPVPEALRA